MLTLLETTNAITSLDTEKDIIANACRQILYGEIADALKGAEPAIIAGQILTTFGYTCEDKTDFLLALITATAVTAHILVKPGHESDLVQTITRNFVEKFAELRAQRLHALRLKDPEAAAQELLAMLNKLPKGE